MRNLAIIPFCFLMLILLSNSNSTTKIQQALSQFKQDSDLQNASWSFYAKRVQDNQLLAAYDENRSLPPASTLKTITTMTALQVLGKDYTFTTNLAYDGFVDRGGTLQGNLYIIGTGDPTLGTDRDKIANGYEKIMSKWVTTIKNVGIKQINGCIIGDGTAYGTDITPSDWLWEDIGNYYGAGAAGLNFRENRFDVFLKSGGTGGSTTLVSANPKIEGITIVNEVKAGAAGSGDNAYIYGAPYNNTYYIRGTIPPNQSRFKIKGAVPDPAAFCAKVLAQNLAKNGVSTSQTATSKRLLKLEGKFQEQKLQIFHKTTSPPLSDIVYWVNKRSINLYAESLLRAIGKKRYGIGTPKKGLEAVEEFWKERGVNLDGFFMRDGSGLSPINAVTTKQIVEMLRKFTHNQDLYPTFLQSLPVAGDSNDDGALKYFMKGTAAAKKMQVKSGYIEKTRGYVGYVTNKKGEQISFALLVTNYNCTNTAMRKKMEKLLTALAE
ncbi:MAG: D-alanyl-D-alanine carboxypeptidase/D-alanyl-D-alanine endopeptidase [Chitinophagales bacterium]